MGHTGTGPHNSSNDWENIPINKLRQDLDIEMLHKGLNNLSDEVTKLAARIVTLETKVDKVIKFLNDRKNS
jgi:hypothetical protein